VFAELCSNEICVGLYSNWSVLFGVLTGFVSNADLVEVASVVVPCLDVVVDEEIPVLESGSENVKRASRCLRA
jgi:hypothetical protein